MRRRAGAFLLLAGLALCAIANLGFVGEWVFALIARGWEWAALLIVGVLMAAVGYGLTRRRPA